MSTIEKNISEIVNVLQSVNCPLIVRTDDWWIEELFFTPGKPRKDLIVWITSKAIESAPPSALQFQLKLQDLDTTATSSSSSNLKLPESDEGNLILLYLFSAIIYIVFQQLSLDFGVVQMYAVKMTYPL
jgi:hypothetical protein